VSEVVEEMLEVGEWEGWLFVILSASEGFWLGEGDPSLRSG